MMKPDEARSHLALLGLSASEAAQLLGIGLRTVRRWTVPEREGQSAPLPGSAEAALRAWLKLHRLGLAWRPEAQSLNADDTATIAAHRGHGIELAAVLERVRLRRGPAAPWDVDVERGRAALGPLLVTFHRLRNGEFAPQSYSRSDDVPIDLLRDQALLEDAYACIATKLAGETATPRTAFAFDEPEHSLAWDDLIEMWDTSLTPAVVCTVACAALRDAFALSSLSDDDLLRFVRRNKVALTALAEALFAQSRYKDVRVDAALAPVFRRVDLGVEDLRPLASTMRRLAGAAAIEGVAGSAP